jgi:hypothetical protein
VNAAALQAWLEQNKKPVLAVAGAGVVGLALLRKKKTAAAGGIGGGGAPASAGTAFATGPAIAGTATPYDSSVSDVYNSLQGQLDSLNTKLTAPIPTPAAPSASKMFAPGYTGNYVRLSNGVIGEVENDGSIFGLTGQQWRQAADQGAQYSQLASAPTWYSTEQNTNTAAAAAALTKQA